MKLTLDNDITIYLNKEYLEKLNINTKNINSNYILKIIDKIKSIHKIDINGYYNAYIYIDNNYGIIINIQKEEIEYFDYFNTVELNINVTEDNFLYKIDDIFNLSEYLLNKFTLYKNKENIYLKVKEQLTNIEMGTILENSKIIYGKKVKKIINKSKKV